MMEVQTNSELVDHLRARGLVPTTGPIDVAPLGGGVSNDVFEVSVPGADMVVKRALHTLRVAETWHADPARIDTEARALEVAGALVSGSTPRVIDLSGGWLVISHAPRTWRTWKDELLAGRIDIDVAARLGRTLGQWQCLSARRPDLLREFDDQTAFEQLRIDPFHHTVAARHPDLAPVIEGVIERMHADRRSLVHGDYSPKNVLVDPDGDGVWVIDWEVAHTGDPTFDPSWIVGHLLLKSVRDPANATTLRSAAAAFLSALSDEAGQEVPLSSRQLTAQLGCLVLARADGKSPVEYLDDDGRETARRVGTKLLTSPPTTATDAWELL